MDITGIGSVADLVGRVADKIWPDPVERDQAKLKLYEAKQAGHFRKLDGQLAMALAQSTTNTAEAANANTFVSGWRPFIGWICGSGLAMQFIIGPLATWGGALAGRVVIFPSLDMGTLITLLAGMLGLGAMRTVEKLNGVAAK